MQPSSDLVHSNASSRVLAFLPLLVGAGIAAMELNRRAGDRVVIAGIQLLSVGIALLAVAAVGVVLGRLVTVVSVQTRELIRYRTFVLRFWRVRIPLAEVSRLASDLSSHRGVKGRGSYTVRTRHVFLRSSRRFCTFRAVRKVELGSDTRRIDEVMRQIEI